MSLRHLVPCAVPFLLLACGDDGGGTGGAGSGGAGSGGGDVVSACAPVTGEGTTHLELTGDETWTAEGSPHIVAADLIVAEGTTLTVEPCAEVRLEPGRRIQVRGTLDAPGAADRTILFTATDGASPWGSLVVTDPGRMTLAHTTVEKGGAPDATSYGMIDLRGDQVAAAAPVLDVDHVTVRDSSTFGVSLRENAGFAPGSTALTVTGSAAAPLRTLPRLATNIPDGDLTGNAEDVIAVEAEVGGNVDLEDVTFHDRGVPYRVGGVTLPDLVVGPSPVTLTIEPGVELRFGPAGRLIVDVNGDVGGALSAVGTAEAPIVFTSASATPQPGDWVGLWIEHVDPATRLEHVEIRHAGGPSGANSFHCEPDGTFSDEDALITFWEAPTAGIITQSLLTDSPKRGINLAYTGNAVDLMATNTFENVGGCKISTPRPEEGQCPASSPCP